MESPTKRGGESQCQLVSRRQTLKNIVHHGQIEGNPRCAPTPIVCSTLLHRKLDSWSINTERLFFHYLLIILLLLDKSSLAQVIILDALREFCELCLIYYLDAYLIETFLLQCKSRLQMKIPPVICETTTPSVMYEDNFLGASAVSGKMI